MDVNYMEITPSIAAMWLKQSHGNPRWKSGKLIDSKRVSKISEDITLGKWNPGNNSIAFDENGVLVDGHHRLSAIVKANKSVYSIVVTGLNNDGIKHIDENRSRTVSQRLGLSTHIVAVVNCHSWMKDGISTSNPTLEEISVFVKKHPFIYDATSISCTGSCHPIAKKAGVSHGILCALECDVPIDIIHNFIKCVNTGFISGTHESAAIVLRNMLLRAVVKTRTDSLKIDCATQSALQDYIDCVPRKNAYHVNRGLYFDKLYT